MLLRDAANPLPQGVEALAPADGGFDGPRRQAGTLELEPANPDTLAGEQRRVARRCWRGVGHEHRGIHCG
eukprot:15448775-Alexandrium_andersonii.AAC.1